MMLAGIAFYVFSFLLLLSALLVISARNPVHSVLWLIVSFFNAAGLFLLLGAEFTALILVIVYVGAVAVLFLFVVMMLDINIQELRAGFLQYMPFGALVGVVLVIELALVVGAVQFDPKALTAQTPIPEGITATHALGNVLYTHYIYEFQVSGLILLVAMIGAIVLTLRGRGGVRRQKSGDQIARQPSDAMAVKQVNVGSGVEL
ncbi:MAG: NADH-quinone oxidoreductase subunit J [Alphaproteobacteria bacterium]